MDDYTLVQQCMGGDDDAFSEIVSRYKNLVYSVILRMINDSEQASDLAQEIFLKVYRNLDKYSPEFKFSTWIIRITTNHVIDYRRKKRLETVQLEDVVNEPASFETPESEYIKSETRSLVMGALNQLPDMYKIPMILYHEKGMSYQEIADIIEEPLSKVKNRIFRARKMLKETLSQTMS